LHFIVFLFLLFHLARIVVSTFQFTASDFPCGISIIYLHYLDKDIVK
jgi:hypothetical protein